MMTATEGLHGGLSSLAETLQIERIGPMHQAGSDSLLTAQVFFGLTKKHFNGVCDDSRYFPLASLFIQYHTNWDCFHDNRFKGELYGVGSNHTKYKNKYPPSTNNNNQNNGITNPQHPQLQFSSTVHYPASMALTQSPATTTFGYDEGY
jgi:hypothetical protein